MIIQKGWLLLLALSLTVTAAESRAQVIDEIAKVEGSICNPAMKGLKATEVRNRKAVFLDRQLAPWVKIEPYLQAPLTAEEIATQMKKDDSRGKVFQSVEQLKFYEDFYKDTDYEKAIEKLTGKINDLEDTLGFSVDADKLPVKLTQLGADPRAIAWAQKRASQGMKKLVALLKEDRWLGKQSKMLTEMVALYDEMDFPSQAEDAEYLEKVIQKHIDGILAVNWDMSVLQEQLHKLRRLLRKLSILKAAARGKIQSYAGGVPESLAKLQNVPDNLKPFMKVEQSPFPIKEPIYFLEAAENALTIFIEDFGKLKDRGEIYTLSMEALVESGAFGKDKKAATQAADAWLRPKLKEVFGWEYYLDDAIKKYQEFIDSKVLEHLLVPRSEVESTIGMI